MNFVLNPYAEIGPLRFGMREQAVVDTIGRPQKAFTNRRGEPDFQYADFSIRLSTEERRLVEVGFYPSANFIVEGVDVFGDAGTLDKLLCLDSDVFEYHGFVVFFGLGLTLTGFHDGDESQKAATCFERGRWDHLKAEMRPFRSTSYLNP